MGQKVHPIGYRLGYIRQHQASWFADRSYREFVTEDMRIRAYLDRFAKKKPPTVAHNLEERKVEESLENASISRVEIGRSVNTVMLTIHAAKPGIIIGRAGRGIEVLRYLLQRLTRRQVQIDVVEERNPDTDARLVAEKIASQLSRRISFRRAIRQAVQTTMRSGALGVKVTVAGRLAGGEMARRHVHKEGKIPLQTLRADIDYGTCEAPTTYGNIGVKCWVYRGERLPDDEVAENGPTIIVEQERPSGPSGAPAGSDGEAPKGRRRGRRRVASDRPDAPAGGDVMGDLPPAMGPGEE
ncbi:MAG: 30S ribosomal protein S3 [Fimbriimonadaceae bacterium]|nr:30S ribosomal protein S3 [Fimbriimonadaceae bacterium]